MPTRYILSITLLAAASSAASAADAGTWDYWVRVQASAGSIGLSGDASYEANGLDGTTFAMSDVGLDSREITPAFELGLTTPVFNLHGFIGYQAWATDGSGTLSKRIDFGGQTFNAGVTVDGEAAISDLYAEISWGPIELNVAGFAIGLAAHQLSAETELSAAGQRAAFDDSGVIPTLALRGYVAPIDALEVEAMVHGLAVPLGDVSGSFLAAQVQASFYPITHVGVFAGYRHTMIDIEFDDGSRKAEANVALGGPFLGLAAQF